MSLATERTCTLKNSVTNTMYLWLSIDTKKEVLNPAFSNFQQQKQTNQENNSYKTFWEKKKKQSKVGSVQQERRGAWEFISIITEEWLVFLFTFIFTIKPEEKQDI